MTKARFVSIGGILTTIAVLFQSAPVYLPGIGLAISPFSTLPIALAAFLSIPLGIAVYLCTALILTFIFIQEAVILVFTTGILGIAIGTFLYRRGLITSILFSSTSLSLGMLSLTYLAGIAAFGDFTITWSTPYTIAIFLSFSLVYATIWNISLKKFIHFLIKINVF